MPTARQEPRWKKEERHRRHSRLGRSISKIAIIIFVGFAILLGLKIASFIKNQTWDGRNQINLVINTTPVLLVSFDPGHEKINVLKIPPETFVEAVRGYGSYRIESIYRLGEIEAGKGGDLLSGSVQDFFGVPVDSWVDASKITPELTKAKQYLRRLFALAALKEVKSGLSSWDLVRLWWGLNSLKGFEINTIGVEQTSASEKVVLADGSEAVVIDPERFAQVAKKLFVDDTIGQEGLAIAVVNGTPHPGLANRVGKVIENLGGRVVELGSLEGKTTFCQLLGAEKKAKSQTVKRLTRLFDCRWGGEAKEGFRADVVLILGEDYWEKLTKKYD
jgi:hypothetical protein